VIESNSNQNNLAPDVTIASVVIDLPGVFLEVARQIKTRKFIPHVISLALHDDVARLVLNPRMSAVIPERIRIEVDSVRTALINGTLKLPHAQ
jgi:basic membrane lipoprotein Med (substrate-binding protein (PBP1-ABC) superfamily)